MGVYLLGSAPPWAPVRHRGARTTIRDNAYHAPAGGRTGCDSAAMFEVGVGERTPPWLNCSRVLAACPATAGAMLAAGR